MAKPEIHLSQFHLIDPLHLDFLCLCCNLRLNSKVYSVKGRGAICINCYNKTK